MLKLKRLTDDVKIITSRYRLATNSAFKSKRKFFQIIRFHLTKSRASIVEIFQCHSAKCGRALREAGCSRPTPDCRSACPLMPLSTTGWDWSHRWSRSISRLATSLSRGVHFLHLILSLRTTASIVLRQKRTFLLALLYNTLQSYHTLSFGRILYPPLCYWCDSITLQKQCFALKTHLFNCGNIGYVKFLH
jgi:hypothetical protein